MSNPLFQALAGNQIPTNPTMQMIQQFVQFKNNFKGNPQEEVMKLLQSGRLNQQQLNQLQCMAQQLQKMMNGAK